MGWDNLRVGPTGPAGSAGAAGSTGPTGPAGSEDGVVSTLRVGPTGAGSIQPLEIVGPDAGLAITSLNEEVNTEAYIAAFIKDAAHNFRKIGATAHIFTDPNTTDGFASWNVHATKLANGVSADEFLLAVWAKHGAAFFPPYVIAAAAPGDKILRINGALDLTGELTLNGDVWPRFDVVLNSARTDVTGDGTEYPLTGSIFTELNDRGSHFSDGTFTAPIAGVYNFFGVVRMDGILNTHTFGYIPLKISSPALEIGCSLGNFGTMMALGGALSIPFNVVVPMDQGATAILYAYVANGTKVVDVIANSTRFSGLRVV